MIGRIVNAVHLWLLQRRADIIIDKTARVSRRAQFYAGGRGRIRIGKRCEIGASAILNCHGGSIELGDDSTVNEGAVLYGHGGLKIGSGVRIAAQTVIIPANHGIARGQPVFRQPQTKLGIVIEDDVWIGTGARILDGVTLATGSVVGAGAVVTRSTEPYSINVGVPARKIGERS